MDYYTGKMSKYIAEQEILEKESNVTFFTKIWNELVTSKKNESFFQVLKSIVFLLFSFPFLLLAIFFSDNNSNIELKRRVHFKIARFIFIAWLIIFILLTNLLNKPKDWKDFILILFVFVFSFLLSTRFLKIIILKK